MLDTRLEPYSQSLKAGGCVWNSPCELQEAESCRKRHCYQETALQEPDATRTLCISHESEVGLPKGVDRVLLRETGQENHREVQQGNESKSRKGKTCTGNQLASRRSHCPLQGSLWVQDTQDGRIPEEPLKYVPRKNNPATGPCLGQRTPRPNYNRIVQASLPCSLPLLACPLQPCREQGEALWREGLSKGGKTLSQKEKQSDRFPAGPQSKTGPT